MKTKAAKDAGTDKLFYADDTLLISSSANVTNKVIKTIMKHSERYGLSLNLNKCEVIYANKKKKAGTEPLRPLSQAPKQV